MDHAQQQKTSLKPPNNDRRSTAAQTLSSAPTYSERKTFASSCHRGITKCHHNSKIKAEERINATSQPKTSPSIRIHPGRYIFTVSSCWRLQPHSHHVHTTTSTTWHIFALPPKNMLRRVPAVRRGHLIHSRTDFL